MRSASGCYVVTLNGEIYSFKVLRQKLDRLGHAFRRHSDTDVGDSARIVGNSGDVVQPRDSVALANALKNIIELGEERKKLGMLARKRIKDNYSLEKIVSQYEKIYVSLARNVVQ